MVEPFPKKRKTELLFTVHAVLQGEGLSCTVELTSNDTVGGLREKVARGLGVGEVEITLRHDGEPLDDLSVNVTKTTLVEGSEVVVGVSSTALSKAELRSMGLGWEIPDIEKALRKGGECVAMTIQLMLDANTKLVGNPLASPLCVAACTEQLEALKVLTARPEADINMVTSRSNLTPLHWAAQLGHSEIVRHLVTVPGIELSAVDSRWSTPLHHGVTSGSVPTIEALINAGAKIEARDDFGATPLHRAASKGTFSIVDYLVTTAGADINARTSCGETPLDMAQSAANFEVAAFLRSRAD